MGYKYTGDSVLGLSLTVNTPKPLDVRTVVDNLALLYTIPAATAYQGMTVANIADGNIYMLVDKSRIDEKAGWRASYESILIIGCTEEEYKEWLNNTSEENTPIDESKSFIHPNTYYYIYEDSIEDKSQLYLTRSWGESIEETLSKKASADGLQNVLDSLNNTKSNLENNYLTSEYIIETYASKELVESKLNETLLDYYTSSQVDEIFVTKESLRGGLDGDEDNFVFVTQSQYSEDQKSIQELLDKTIKTDSNGLLQSITVSEIKSPITEENQEQLSVQVTSEGLLIGTDVVAKKSEIPVIQIISQEEFDLKSEQKDLDENVFYYVYNTDDNVAYVTKEYLNTTYTPFSETQQWVASNYVKQSVFNEELSKLQKSGDYVTLEYILNYYTKLQIDENFFTKDLITTKEEFVNFSNEVKQDYVTIAMLKGDNEDDDDFMFVTLKQYAKDKTNDHTIFNTKLLNTTSASILGLNILKIEKKEIELNDPQTGEITNLITNQIVSNVSITSNNNKLLLNGYEAALSKDVPNIITLEQSTYNDLVLNNEIIADAYYCTYSDRIDDWVITNKKLEDNYYNKGFIDRNFYTKQQVVLLINESVLNLRDRVSEQLVILQNRISKLEEVSNILDLGKLDLITLK